MDFFFLFFIAVHTLNPKIEILIPSPTTYILHEEKELTCPFVSFRWWRNLGLMENLSFARDRLAESFMCSMGVAFEPKYTFLRKWLTKVINLILIIDDVYDVYGTLEELKHFTNAIYRLALHNITTAIFQ